MLGQIAGAPQEYSDKSREKLRDLYRCYPRLQVALLICYLNNYLKKVTMSHAFMQCWGRRSDHGDNVARRRFSEIRATD